MDEPIRSSDEDLCQVLANWNIERGQWVKNETRREKTSFAIKYFNIAAYKNNTAIFKKQIEARPQKETDHVPSLFASSPNAKYKVHPSQVIGSPPLLQPLWCHIFEPVPFDISNCTALQQTFPQQQPALVLSNIDIRTEPPLHCDVTPISTTGYILLCDASYEPCCTTCFCWLYLLWTHPSNLLLLTLYSYKLPYYRIKCPLT